jgi:Ca2+-binding RTX toxin-like protein
LTRKLALAASFFIALLAMLAPSASAAPGALRVLVTTNNGITELQGHISALPGVAHVDTFATNAGTPTAAQLSTYDLVVSAGDANYNDPATWGNRLADFIDAGGAMTQVAYDNWDHAAAHPTGRFESGGYAPFIPGPNDNQDTTLGQRLDPSSPLLAGVPDFATGGETTNDPLASGARLLAKWANGQNAIALKGRVVSVTAGADDGQPGLASLARLAVNAGNVLGRHRFSVSKTGAGTGTVTSSPAGISCGATCAANLPLGPISFAATPGVNSAFTGWSGPCSGTAACSLGTPTRGATVTANFASTLRCGNPLIGTKGANTLVGSPFGDTISGLAGNDRLSGVNGDDCLNGGSGSDRLSGGSGKDRLVGSSGKDRLDGGSGNDSLDGGSGNDRVSGGSGKDRLVGGSGNDRLIGGPGNDRLSGGKGKNVLSGGSGNDVINVDDGKKDTASCGPGKDRVIADPKDKVKGCEKVRRH